MLLAYVGSTRDLMSQKINEHTITCPRLQPYFIGFCFVGVGEEMNLFM